MACKRCRRNGKQCTLWSDCSFWSSLIWIYIVCPDLSVQKLSIITVSVKHKDKWAATRQNQQSDCAPSEDSDQPGHPPSDQHLRCPHEESLGPQLPIERIAKTDQTGRIPRLIWVFPERTATLLVLSCCGSNFFSEFRCNVDKVLEN